MSMTPIDFHDPSGEGDDRSDTVLEGIGTYYSHLSELTEREGRPGG